MEPTEGMQTEPFVLVDKAAALAADSHTEAQSGFVSLGRSLWISVSKFNEEQRIPQPHFSLQQLPDTF